MIEPEPAYWLILGIALIIGEMFTATFASLWFGISAIIVALLTWLFPSVMPSWQIQILFWLISSVIVVVFWFKVIQPSWREKHKKAGLGSGELIGETGMIVKVPTLKQSGTVRFHVPIFGSTEWQCRSLDDNINMGDRVMVTDIMGNELVVRSTKRPLQADTLS